MLLALVKKILLEYFARKPGSPTPCLRVYFSVELRHKSYLQIMKMVTTQPQPICEPE